MGKRNLAIDVAALAVYLVVANPGVTGIGVHEWLGLGVLLAFLVHAAMHVDWVIEALGSALSRPSWARTGNLVLDVFVVVAFMTATVSGIMVSGAVLPALGLYAEGYYFWDPLHATAAKILLALLLVHVAVHGEQLAKTFKKGRRARHGGRSGN